MCHLGWPWARRHPAPSCCHQGTARGHDCAPQPTREGSGARTQGQPWPHAPGPSPVTAAAPGHRWTPAAVASPAPAWLGLVTSGRARQLDPGARLPLRALHRSGSVEVSPMANVWGGCGPRVSHTRVAELVTSLYLHCRVCTCTKTCTHTQQATLSSPALPLTVAQPQLCAASPGAAELPANPTAKAAFGSHGQLLAARCTAWDR